MRPAEYVIDDPAETMFRVNRRALVAPEIYARERDAVFDRSWLYVGHGSELALAGDFKTRDVGGRPLIFCRDAAGVIRAFFNTCRHRGATVCRERAGNARRFFCFYHGWTYATDGALAHVPGEESYGPGFDKAALGLTAVPRLESYRDFWFASLDSAIVPLVDHLAGAKEYIDLVVDQSPSGRMQVIQGVQEYDVASNWKLLVENSFDDYHLLTTHSTWLGYLKDAGVAMARPAAGELLPAHGVGKALGNGHACVDNVNFRGRPVARWIPIYGEDARDEIALIRAELVSRLGEARAARVADTNRNLVVFPNLVLNDGSSVTIRTFFPVSADRMRVTAWALGPIEESASARARRLDSFLTFYGPGGFATPDDVEALEMVQKGLATWNEVKWSEMSRGMNKTGETLNTDEEHLRAFWRRWRQMMEGA